MNWKKIDNIDELKRIGSDLHYAGKYKETIKVSEKILKFDPDNIETLHDLANALSKLRKYDKAIKVFLKIIKINPKDETAILRLPLQYLMKNKKRL